MRPSIKITAGIFILAIAYVLFWMFHIEGETEFSREAASYWLVLLWFFPFILGSSLLYYGIFYTLDRQLSDKVYKKLTLTNGFKGLVIFSVSATVVLMAKNSESYIYHKAILAAIGAAVWGVLLMGRVWSIACRKCGSVVKERRLKYHDASFMGGIRAKKIFEANDELVFTYCPYCNDYVKVTYSGFDQLILAEESKRIHYALCRTNRDSALW